MSMPQEIALASVHANPHQPRFAMDDEVIAGARAALEEAGAYPVSMAITVRPRPEGGYEIIAGHHRTQAAREAGLDTVWAYVQELDDCQAALALATTNNQRGMAPLEHARHALKLKELYGISTAEYAKRVGKNPSNIDTAITALRILDGHGGEQGPNANLPVATLAALRTVDDHALRGSLLVQFRARATTAAQAATVVSHLRAGRPMREAFERAEGRFREPAPRGSYTTLNGGDANMSRVTHLNEQLVRNMEGTLALFQARCEVLERYLPDRKVTSEPTFLEAVALRQRKLLAELRGESAAPDAPPGGHEIACASCAHGKVNVLSDTGFMCLAGRAAMCLPLTLKRCWVEKENA